MEKIADMMSEDKTEFPERTKETVIRKQGVPLEIHGEEDLGEY